MNLYANNRESALGLAITWGNLLHVTNVGALVNTTANYSTYMAWNS